MTRELAWKPRWAVIMFVNVCERSTLDISIAPAVVTPRPETPGVACVLTPEFAEASKVLAANQGLYNGFLAAGLLWGISLGGTGRAVVTFFLVCVAIASRRERRPRSGR